MTENNIKEILTEKRVIDKDNLDIEAVMGNKGISAEDEKKI